MARAGPWCWSLPVRAVIPPCFRTHGPPENQPRQTGQATGPPGPRAPEQGLFLPAIRTLLRGQGIAGVIPEPAGSDRPPEPTRFRRRQPPAFDKEDYKGRNVVGRNNFNTFKQWRGLATRYDKLALSYRGGAVLRAVSIWLTALGDTP
ncbi:transposase [Arthrobacter sp. ISL-30]|nr:transposase [Arthrobacter sp. ISL-30]